MLNSTATVSVRGPTDVQFIISQTTPSWWLQSNPTNNHLVQPNFVFLTFDGAPVRHRQPPRSHNSPLTITTRQCILIRRRLQPPQTRLGAIDQRQRSSPGFCQRCRCLRARSEHALNTDHRQSSLRDRCSTKAINLGDMERAGPALESWCEVGLTCGVLEDEESRKRQSSAAGWSK